MGTGRTSAAAASTVDPYEPDPDDVGLDHDPYTATGTGPEAGEGVERSKPWPEWVSLLLRKTNEPPVTVWARAQAEQQGDAMVVYSADPPHQGRPDVRVRAGNRQVAVSATQSVFTQQQPGIAKGDEALPSPGPHGGRKARSDVRARDRNLMTVAEFAAHVGVAQSTVFNLLKLGLPAIKSRGLGRRILRDQAVAWLGAGGARRGRKATGGGHG